MKRLTRKKQLKLDKKRKQAKQARKRSSRRNVSLAYHGRKYRTEELVPVHFETELAIRECDEMEQRRLTDQDVRRALETLILQVRSGRLPEIRRDEPLEVGRDNPDQLILWNVRGRWEHYFHDHPRPGRDNLVGVLRTILGSIETWGSTDPASRGYLEFLDDFCEECGSQVRSFESEEELHRFLEGEGDWDPEEE